METKVRIGKGELNKLLKNEIVSEEVIRDNRYVVNWDYVCKYQNLSEDFIRKFKKYVNWCYVSKYQKLSEDFIREFRVYVNWDNISFFQHLSEEFIREFSFDVNWSEILRVQKLSPEFLKEFELLIEIRKIEDEVDCLKLKYKKYLKEYEQKREVLFEKQILRNKILRNNGYR